MRSPFRVAKAQREGTCRSLEIREEGKMTDAETLFARSVVRGSDPEALRSYGAFLLRAGRRKQAAVMFDCILDLTSDADRI